MFLHPAAELGKEPNGTGAFLDRVRGTRAKGEEEKGETCEAEHDLLGKLFKVKARNGNVLLLLLLRCQRTKDIRTMSLAAAKQVRCVVEILFSLAPPAKHDWKPGT